MILRQYLHTDPVIAASYLLGCTGHAAGAVVDPVGEPEHYLKAADAAGLRLRYVVDTPSTPTIRRRDGRWPPPRVPSTSCMRPQRPDTSSTPRKTATCSTWATWRHVCSTCPATRPSTWR